MEILPFRATARNKEVTYASMSSGVSCIAGTQNLATFIRLRLREVKRYTHLYVAELELHLREDPEAETGFSPHDTTPLKTQLHRNTQLPSPPGSGKGL